MVNMNKFIKLGKQRLEEAKILKYNAKSSTEIEFYYNSEIQELRGRKRGGIGDKSLVHFGDSEGYGQVMANIACNSKNMK